VARPPRLIQVQLGGRGSRLMRIFKTFYPQSWSLNKKRADASDVEVAEAAPASPTAAATAAATPSPERERPPPYVSMWRQAWSGKGVVLTAPEQRG